MPAAKTIAKKSMSMPEIRMKAKALGIMPGKMNKVDLIHTIQITERNRPCFGTSNGHCVYIDCCFMDDCLKIRI